MGKHLVELDDHTGARPGDECDLKQPAEQPTAGRPCRLARHVVVTGIDPGRGEAARGAVRTCKRRPFGERDRADVGR